MNAIKRLRRALALLILPALLAACGGSGGESAAPPASTSTLAVGDPAPDFTLSSAMGETVTLSQFKGRPVLLFFHMAVG